MTNEKRIKIYTRHLKYKTVDGIYRLTPKQRRRVHKKYWTRYPDGAVVTVALIDEVS